MRRSAKASRRARSIVEAEAAYLDEHPWCEIRWDDQCRGQATEVDHIANRSVRPDLVTDAANFHATCWWCHHQKTTHPKEARERGLQRRSWEA